jgi:hypothetical protein
VQSTVLLLRAPATSLADELGRWPIQSSAKPPDRPTQFPFFFLFLSAFKRTCSCNRKGNCLVRPTCHLHLHPTASPVQASHEARCVWQPPTTVTCIKLHSRALHKPTAPGTTLVVPAAGRINTRFLKYTLTFMLDIQFIIFSFQSC